MLFGFNLFLRKSNLVPEVRQHEPEFQLSQGDIHFDKGVLVAHIKWSKTNQFCDKPLHLPMVFNRKSHICLVKWCLFMLHKIPAKFHHNLFLYREGDVVLPVTYHDLTVQMHQWLKLIGISNFNRYSSHSLRRGGSMEAFENGVPEITIKTLGNWASNAYHRYIDCTLTNRLKAWVIFNNF